MSIEGKVTETQLPTLRGRIKDIPKSDKTLTKEGYAADANGRIYLLLN